MNPHSEHDIRLGLADLREEAAALERRLSELTRLSQARERAQPAGRPRPARAPFANGRRTAGPAAAGTRNGGGLAGYSRTPHGAADDTVPDALADDAVAGDRAAGYRASGDLAAAGAADRAGDYGPARCDHAWYGSGDDDGLAAVMPDEGHDHPEPDGNGQPARRAGPGLAPEVPATTLETGTGGEVHPDGPETDYPEPDQGVGWDTFTGPAADSGTSGAGAGLPGADELDAAEQRTEILVNRGRPSAYYRGLSRGRKLAIAAGAALALVMVIILVATLSGGSASWPPSVAVMQGEAARACHNPDVKSEPGQVNFACAKSSRQILWVFALLTSGGNPGFADARTGRAGLEPITRAQGGALAWSLNLHHPYDPASPVDSLQVAARAINNIIGGATVTGAAGNPVVQPGLESDAANCLRYTGSAAVATRSGFPALCAQPVTGPAGQAALVADVFQRWVVGASPSVAQDAAVLFANARNPGDPQVQAILRSLQLQHH